MFNGGLKSFLPAPSTFSPHPHNVGLYSIYLTPFSNTFSFPVDRYIMVLSRIPHLFDSCRPTTILRSIIAIAVNAIKTVLMRWRLPYIFKEVFKRFPSFADFYTSSAVIFIFIMAWTIASSVHSQPNSVDPRFGQTVSLACFTNSIISITTTTKGCFPKVEPIDGFLVATLTSADGFLSFNPKDCQTTKLLSDNVFHSGSISRSERYVNRGYYL